MEMKPIGVIHTPYKQKQGMPIQGNLAPDSYGRVIIVSEFVEGLSDLDGFSHAYLIYHFHKAEGYHLKVKPFLDNEERGIFATRSPVRPNHIGLTLVRLDKISGNTIDFSGADMLDGTPLLDIKPFVPSFDEKLNVRCGWFSGKIQPGKKHLSDDRFGK